ncbi:unnamed protein product [Ilex paraguariensis]|uniref:VQ domain-containing protein n=1 Tax=Ilex paraguariensis TaxID=185542 RepID=A0ABC8TMX1_9AQUA
MSPAKFDEGEQTRMVINGPRPSPLKINKDSHVIQKPSSSLLPININSGQAAAAIKQQNPIANHQLRKPVIIYTHSPKIIHTKARDFMSLVQKLTGLSRSEDETAQGDDHHHQKNNHQPKRSYDMKPPLSRDENESSSDITDEKYCVGVGGKADGREENTSSTSPIFKFPSNNNSFLADIPLFTPNSSDFFSSPRPNFRFLETNISPNWSNMIPPSFLEVMKDLPEY